MRIQKGARIRRKRGRRKRRSESIAAKTCKDALMVVCMYDRAQR